MTSLKVTPTGRQAASMPLILILQLMLLIVLVLVVLLESHQVQAMSKRFLKGFIVGAMFAHHHKP